MNTMQMLALAALRGDWTAALALADLLQEEFRNLANQEVLEAQRAAWMSNSTAMEGITLYATPEFRALCRLLNIAWELPTIDVAIIIPAEGLVRIEHNYQARRLTR